MTRVVRLVATVGREPEFSAVSTADISRVDVRYYLDILEKCLHTVSTLVGHPDTARIRHSIRTYPSSIPNSSSRIGTSSGSRTGCSVGLT